MRKTQLVENEYYHIYNRGVDKRNVFLDDFDYIRFLKSIQEFNSVAPIGSLYEKTFRDKNGDPISKKEIGSPRLEAQKTLTLLSFSAKI